MQAEIPLTVPLSPLLSLSVPEKLALIEALSNSMAELPIPQWQRDALDRREADEQSAGDPTLSWEDAVQRARQQHAQQRSV